MYTPFDPFEMLSSFYTPQTTRRVVVIPDSEYQELRQQEAKRQVTALESQANRYRTAVQELEVRILDLQTENNLLEGATATKELVEAIK